MGNCLNKSSSNQVEVIQVQSNINISAVEPKLIDQKERVVKNLSKKTEILSVIDLDNTEHSIVQVKAKIQDDYYNINDWKLLIQSLQANHELNSYALLRKRQDFSSVDELVEFLQKYKPKNDFEKAWLIYVWITDNIKFDLSNFAANANRDNKSASAILRDGVATSAGYSELFQELCTNLNIVSRVIRGYTKAYGYQIGMKLTKEDHAWNAIKLQDRWYYIETTWGAGILIDEKFSKQFNPYFFLSPPVIFNNRHFSNEFEIESNGRALSDFENLPFYDPNFYLYELECLTEKSSIINSTRVPYFIEFKAPREVLITAELFNSNNKIKDKNVFIQRDSKTLNYCIIVFLPQLDKEFSLKVYAKYEWKIGNFDFAAELIIKCSEADENFVFPKYDLLFTENDIKCLNFNSKVIKFDKNPIDIEFLAKNFNIFATIEDMSGNKIENSAMVHSDPVNMNYIVKAVVPKKDYGYILRIYYNEKSSKTDEYKILTKFLLIRSESDRNDSMKLVKCFSSSRDFYIFEPVNRELAFKQEHHFKLFVKDALKVIVTDEKDNITNIEAIKNDNKEIWKLDYSPLAKGKLQVCAMFNNSGNFQALVEYIIN